MRVRQSAQCSKDLIEIWGYVATHSERAADRLLDRFQNRFDKLVDHPRSGRARADFGSAVRQITSGNYAIFYRVHEDEVVILRVLHGARDIRPDDLQG